MRRALPTLFLAGALAAAGLPTSGAAAASRVVDDPVPIAMQRLADLVTDSGTSAPVASRVLAYSAVAMARAALVDDAAARRFQAALVRFPRLVAPGPGIDRDVAAVTAWASTARNLLPTTTDRQAVAVLRDEVLAARSASLPAAGLRASIDWGLQVSRAVRSWSDADGYADAQARGESWTPPAGPGRWVPTPPDAQPAVQPYWGSLRPFLGRTRGCRIPAPVPYSTVARSRYARDVRRVLATSRHLTEHDRATARFWADDHEGARTIAATWVTIAARVIVAEQLGTRDAALLEAAVTTAAADSFIVDWRAKFHWATARPVTVITDRGLARSWTPLITTPASPEYPSAHATVSWSAAAVLGARVGDAAFTVRSGGKTRHFASFREAAADATVSRRDGGVSFDSTLAASTGLGRCLGGAAAVATGG